LGLRGEQLEMGRRHFDRVPLALGEPEAGVISIVGEEGTFGTLLSSTERVETTVHSGGGPIPQ
jgi:hypothetical protein